MPLVHQRVIAKDTELGIWKIQEDESFFLQKMILSREDKLRIADMHEVRRIEWLTGRWLVKKLAGRQSVCKTQHTGKPYLENSKFQISISHSKGLVSVVVAPKNVGIDIQKITPKVSRVAKKFMRTIEAASLQPESYLEHLHVYWGAKEALYKAYGMKGLDFKKHIHVNPFSYQSQGQGNCKGLVAKNEYYSDFDLHYEKYQEHILVFALERPPVSF